MLNGWYYTVPSGYFTDAEGRCIEGIGVAPAPEYTMNNTESDLEAGVDAVSEGAIAHLQK